MENMTLEKIAAVCGGIYIGDGEERHREIQGVAIDSRLVRQGDLFVPIKGARADGHDFIPAVFAKGAAAAFSERELADPAGPYILVQSAVEAMKRLAAYYRRSLDVKVVGVTGSVGKTSTKEMIASVLSQKFRVLKTEGNYNNEIGLPLTIFRIQKEHEAAVLEMGISEFGEMHRLAEMANPNFCVITNIGLCHLENLKTRDGILKAKTESFAHLAEDGIAILNGDDDKLCAFKEVNGRPTVFYGIGREAKTVQDGEVRLRLAEKDVYANAVRAVGLSGTEAVIHAGEESIAVTVPFPGEHNVYNALAAVCVGRQLGMTMEEMKRGIEAARTIGGRGNLVEKDGITVFDDCYNANPVSMNAAIDVLAEAPGRKLAVLGDMKELGPGEKQFHAMVGKHFAGKNIDFLFCTGELAAGIAEAVRESSPGTGVRYFKEKQELLEALMEEKREGDTILVKASHSMGFAEIVQRLLGEEAGLKSSL